MAWLRRQDVVAEQRSIDSIGNVKPSSISISIKKRRMAGKRLLFLLPVVSWSSSSLATGLVKCLVVVMLVQAPFSVPLHVSVLLVGFNGDGGHKFDVNAAEFREFMERSYSTYRPSCVTQKKPLEVR